MNYFEDEKHRIQADMALRIGKIAYQYSQLDLPPEQNFTDTLHLCLLQNLLTNCEALMAAMARENGEDLGLKVPLSEMTDWGLDSVDIRDDSFESSLTVEVFLIHLRHAMSHPTGTDIDARFPSTGYHSIPDAAGMIEAIGFCNSPDTRNNRPSSFPSEKAARGYLERNQGSSPRNPWNQIPGDVEVGEMAHPRGNQFGLFRYGEPYARVFSVVLSTNQLRSLVLGLSNLLAQPAREHWDGHSILEVVAA